MKRLRVLVAFSIGVLASGVLGQAPPLVGPSPFAGDTGSGSGAAAPALELKGIMSDAEGTRYCIYDAATRTGEWVGAAEPGHAFVVRSGDPATETATVETGGRVLLLRLRMAKVHPAALATAETPAVPAEAHAMMTRRLPGEPRAPRAVQNP
jgi:hypothetical protein